MDVNFNFNARHSEDSWWKRVAAQQFEKSLIIKNLKAQNLNFEGMFKGAIC